MSKMLNIDLDTCAVAVVKAEICPERSVLWNYPEDFSAEEPTAEDAAIFERMSPEVLDTYREFHHQRDRWYTLATLIDGESIAQRSKWDIEIVHEAGRELRTTECY